MKALLIFLLLTILVIVTLPYGLQKQVDELDKKKIEKFYNATETNTVSCHSQIAEVNATNRTDLSKCMNDKQNVQSILDTKSTESINYQKNYTDCNKNLSNLQSEFDTYTKNYDNLLKQVVNQQNSLNNNNTIVSVTQETLLKCQSQNVNNTDKISVLQKQYNNLVVQYQDLQKAYKELSDNYYIKCYDYYINTRTSVPAQSKAS